MNERIASAWQNCEEWITVYDGAASEAYLADISKPALELGLITIKSKVTEFSIDPVWMDTVDSSIEDRVHDVYETMLLHEQGLIALLNVIYTIMLDEFDFRVHLMIDNWDEERLDIRVIWWADHVFPPDSNHKERFASVLKHFIVLQNLFQCRHLYLAPETSSRPQENLGDWIEV